MRVIYFMCVFLSSTLQFNFALTIRNAKVKYGSTFFNKASVAILIASTFFGSPTFAVDKQTDLTPSQISQIVADDITVRQALATANFSPEIYDENCVFQDEIDTYDYKQYVKGTQALFNSEKSHTDLIGKVYADDKKVEFKLQETLTFNIPFNPKVKLSGHVELTRGKDGLITYSREFWDQSVPTVLSTISF